MNLTEFCKKHLDKFENALLTSTLSYETLITLKEELASCEEFQNCTLHIEPKGLKSEQVKFKYGHFKREVILNEISLSPSMYAYGIKQPEGINESIDFKMRAIVLRGIFEDFESIETSNEKNYLILPMN